MDDSRFELVSPAPQLTPASKLDAENVDMTTGANPLIRALVGKETDMGRRKQILDRFYSNVTPFGKDNFVATGSDGKPFLVNPKGFDAGDVFGASREIAQGVAGGLAGAALAGEAPWVAEPVAAGTAAATGKAFDKTADGLANLYLSFQGKEPIPATNFWDDMKQAGIETGLGAAGGLALRGAGNVAGKIVNPVSDRLADLWGRIGQQPPSIGAITEGGFWPGMESMASKLALGKNLVNAGASGAEAVGKALDRGAQTISPGGVASSRDDLGQAILGKIKAERAALGNWYDGALDNAVEGDLSSIPGKLGSTLKWIDSVANDLSLSGNGSASQAFREKMHSIVSSQIADATGKNVATGLVDQAGNPILRSLPPELNLQSLKNMRTVLREQIENMPELTMGNVRQGALKSLRGAIQDDILDSLPPDIRARYQAAQNVYGQRAENLDALESYFGGGRSPQQVGDTLASASVDPEKLRRLQAMPNFGEDALDDVAAYQAKHMADGTAGKTQTGANAQVADRVFSPDVAVTNANKMFLDRPEVGDLLYGGLENTPRSARDALELALNMKQQNLYANPSGTAQQLAQYDRLKNLAAGALGLGGLLNVAPGALPAAIGGIVGPEAISRIATSPTAIRTLLKPSYRNFWDAALNGSDSLASNIGRDAGLMSARSWE